MLKKEMRTICARRNKVKCNGSIHPPKHGQWFR